MNSWDRSDSYTTHIEDPNTLQTADFEFFMGDDDLDLMTRLARGGAVHAKYRRMTPLFVDITAPLYWWKEFDTYKVGTTANSCSTMHKIQAIAFRLEDFSHEHLIGRALITLKRTIDDLNYYRDLYNNGGVDVDTGEYHEPKDKDIWWQMIQELPSSYNQKRTLFLNYEVLVGMCRDRKNHKLDEWREFCQWIKTLPYSEIITGEYEINREEF
jgi:diadenosine tetraphosphatase ApaH/serine/threonine PP2A family protein phosphatase